MTVSHPRFPARRGAVRPRSWWGRAWVRSLEESSYDESDLTRARSLARSGRLGSIGLESGAAITTVADVAVARLAVPPLDEESTAAFFEAIRARSGRIAALLAGDLPLDLVEHAEETGVELIPYAGELAWSCNCDPWVDPCEHALALGYQLGWLLDADPGVLLLLRGITRESLLALGHDPTNAPRTDRTSHPDASPGPSVDEDPDADADADPDPDVAVALDAALEAARLLTLAERPELHT